MKSQIALIKRNIKETLRDPLSLVFCIAFPVVMLVFMQLIIGGLEYVPANFNIESYAFGICVFGYTFTGMFVSMNVASDKNSLFIKRIEISPISRLSYLLSFFFSALPIALVQTLLFFAIAIPFGLKPSLTMLLALVYMLPSAVFYISTGILIGVLCKNEKQTGPISSILISAVGMLAGVFMPLSLFSGAAKAVVYILPFSHTVEIARDLYVTGPESFISHFPYILVYVLIIWGLIIVKEKLFKK